MSEAPDIEWTIPESWAWSRMGEIASVIGGGTPRTDDPSNYEGGEIAWITPADLSGYTHKYIQRGARNITQRGLENSGARTMPAGTVLFSSRAPIGYVAIAANPVSTNQGFKSFVLPEDLSPDYIYYYLQRAKEIARGLASGTTFLEISGAKATIIPVPVAPRPEQDRIVDEIDKQFTRLDDAVAALKRVRSNLKRYRASVLKAACEGRLVSTEAELARKEGRSYEPASELLKRILAERRAKWTGKTKYVEPHPSVDNLPELPDGWVWASLNQLLREPLRNGHSAKETTGAGIRTLTLTAVTYGDFSESNVKVTSADPEKVRDLWIQPGDIFVERSNTPELVGIARLFSGPENFAIFPDLLIRVRLCALVSAKFIEALLLSESVRHYFRRSAQGISGSMPKVDQGVIERLPVPLPPLAEQCRIATEIEHQCAQLLASEQDAIRAIRLANNLRQSILKYAFSGKLVPQDHNDEPASALLERIRAERAALATDNGNQEATSQAGTTNGQRRRRIKKLAQGVSPGKG